jgi:hypothetical protein
MPTTYYSAPQFALSGTPADTPQASTITRTTEITNIDEKYKVATTVNREQLADTVLGIGALFKDTQITIASSNQMLGKIWTHYSSANTNLARITVDGGAPANWTTFVTALNLPALVANATPLPALTKDDVLYLPIALTVGGGAAVSFYYQLTLLN